MYLGMALSTAKHGKKEALVAAAKDHAQALRAQPGCLATYVLDERGTMGQVSISIFESEEAFRSAAEATRPVIGRHRLETLLEAPPEFRVFDVR
jgi:heme-degrading monooxygenase HmoA